MGYVEIGTQVHAAFLPLAIALVLCGILVAHAFVMPGRSRMEATAFAVGRRRPAPPSTRIERSEA